MDMNTSGLLSLLAHRRVSTVFSMLSSSGEIYSVASRGPGNMCVVVPVFSPDWFTISLGKSVALAV